MSWADTDTGEFFNDDRMAVIGVMANDLKGAPVLKYLAKMVKSTQDLDLAMLQIVGLLDDAQAELPKNLGLIAIGRGNSDELLPGDEMAVIGYPGLGGSTVTFTEGVVSGFLDEDADGVYEWIKTDTEVNPGNSGGLAIDRNGDFVGVPTAGYSRADVAGKISLVRPGVLALQFYDNAALGQGGGMTSRPRARVAAARADRPSPMCSLAPTVDRQNRDRGPHHALRQRRHRHLRRLQLQRLQERSGIQLHLVSGWRVGFQRPVQVAGGRQRAWIGSTFIATMVCPMARMKWNSASTASGSIAAASPWAQTPPPAARPQALAPSSLPPRWAKTMARSNAGNAFVDIDTIYGFFDFSDVQAGTPWSTRWLHDGEEVLAEDAEWDDAESGSTWVSLNHPDGLPDGRFTLELYLDGELSQSASFTVAAREQRQSGSSRSTWKAWPTMPTMPAAPSRAPRSSSCSRA